MYYYYIHKNWAFERWANSPEELYTVLFINPCCINKKNVFQDNFPEKVITWVSSKKHGEYLLELTPLEWNKVCSGDISLKDIPPKELPFLTLNFSLFLVIKDLFKDSGFKFISPIKLISILFEEKIIPIQWEEFYSLFYAITPNAPLTEIRWCKFKVDSLLNAIAYFVKTNEWEYSEQKFELIKKLMMQGFAGEKLHLLVTELSGE